MFSCLQILEAFLWFVLITLLNVTLIILTLSVSRLLNLLLRLVAFRSEERFSRNAETDLVCRLLLEKKKQTWRKHAQSRRTSWRRWACTRAPTCAHRVTASTGAAPRSDA